MGKCDGPPDRGDADPGGPPDDLHGGERGGHGPGSGGDGGVPGVCAHVRRHEGAVRYFAGEAQDERGHRL